MRIRGIIGLLGIIAGFASATHAAGLTLHPDRAGPLDLAVSGELEGLTSGETAYVRAADLQTLPAHSRLLTIQDQFLPGKQTLKIVMLSDLWAALPKSKNADMLLADCGDGYASVFPQTFIETRAPFLVLEINGRTLDAWKELGFKSDAGPYIIGVSESLSPGVMTVLDIGHKQPWGVNRLRVAAAETYFSALIVPASAAAGREIWINSCYSCHQGPDQKTGGTKSGVPFARLQSYANFNKPYLKQYVRDPRSLSPQAKMEPHPHYTDEQLNALIAFLRAVE